MSTFDDAVVTSVAALPKQLEQSFREALAVPFSKEYKNASQILVCGMGGSRFPALIISHLFKKSLKVPLVVNDDYTLPAWSNENTLIILSSYSGTTEEILTCGEKATERKLPLLTGITAGGEVAAMLRKQGKPVYVFDPIHNPSGQPRIGFGYAVGGLLGILLSLGYILESKESINDAIKVLPDLLKSFAVEVPDNDNVAKQLAEKLKGKYPYYILSEFLTGVGNAVANQTNETAKSISSFQVIPELNHHLMEGLKHPKELQQLGVFVFFFSQLYSAVIQKRFRITKEVVEQNKLGTEWVELKGKTAIEQTLELMGLGSYLSMYLSALYGEDPNVIPYVDYFKQRLKEDS